MLGVFVSASANHRRVESLYTRARDFRIAISEQDTKFKYFKPSGYVRRRIILVMCTYAVLMERLNYLISLEAASARSSPSKSRSVLLAGGVSSRFLRLRAWIISEHIFPGLQPIRATRRSERKFKTETMRSVIPNLNNKMSWRYFSEILTTVFKITRNFLAIFCV